MRIVPQRHINAYKQITIPLNLALLTCYLPPILTRSVPLTKPARKKKKKRKRTLLSDKKT
ncbi:hypothetical protein P167DRAFT_240478 [Morchella conica CCBAS932]|uniref:Uncharacterized protein n=1 Tax=Morchella conica CCBAS932 TaxID=1392247 RepID=A0A3N4KJP4_9PEZI|nr:hypothetical protein P167DRAFT_240478 [Morchella conica CCBAS932]